jgi:hypothetical protein
MRFLRACVVMLPSAFLAAAFAFLLSHDPRDASLSVYPFLADWLGRDRIPRAPALQFLLQSGLLFAGLLALWTAYVALVAGAERAILGAPPRPPERLLRRAFRVSYASLVLLLAAGIGASSGYLKTRLLGGMEIGPSLVALAPFLAGALALLPAAAAAVPVAAILRMRD